MSEKEPTTFTIIVCGDEYVGKTSLIEKFIKDESVQTDADNKTVSLSVDGKNVKVQIVCHTIS